MNEEQADFFDRLVQLERQAAALANELPPGLHKSRAEHVAMTLRLLKARFDVMGPVILPTQNKP